MKVTEYLLVSEIGTEAFNKKVNELLSSEWQPFGGVASFFINLPIHDGTYKEIGMQYSQAMVKYENQISI